MREVIMTGLVAILMLVVMWGMYVFGRENGKHRERMRLIDIMENIPTIVTTQEHVWYVVNYIVTRLREE